MSCKNWFTIYLCGIWFVRFLALSFAGYEKYYLCPLYEICMTVAWNQIHSDKHLFESSNFFLAFTMVLVVRTAYCKYVAYQYDLPNRFG